MEFPLIFSLLYVSKILLNFSLMTVMLSESKPVCNFNKSSGALNVFLTYRVLSYSSDKLNGLLEDIKTNKNCNGKLGRKPCLVGENLENMYSSCDVTRERRKEQK